VVEVGNEGQRCLEVLLDYVEPQLKGRESLLAVVEFPADAFLLDLEQVERDRVRVVTLSSVALYCNCQLLGT
jgi:hypothetical protein